MVCFTASVDFLATIWTRAKKKLPSWQPEVIVLIEVFGRGERIRTSDLTVPNRALYQAEPRPDKEV
jgi:hypothetical protein